MANNNINGDVLYSDLVSINDDQVVTSSRNIAEHFGKRHDNVIRDIDNYLKTDALNFEDMFFASTYKDSYGRDKRAYLMNRDGFSLLVMGFTGKAALTWKLHYIQAFNAMEKQLREQQSGFDISSLSPEMQAVVASIKEIARIAKEQKDLKNRTDKIETTINAMDEVIRTNAKQDNWRQVTNTLIRRIAANNGDKDYSAVYHAVYDELNKRASCDVYTRYRNRISRMEARGATKREIDKCTILDIIADSKPLKETYVTIVKELYMNSQVTKKDLEENTADNIRMLN